jgi:hypothetical protein
MYPIVIKTFFNYFPKEVTYNCLKDKEISPELDLSLRVLWKVRK